MSEMHQIYIPEWLLRPSTIIDLGLFLWRLLKFYYFQGLGDLFSFDHSENCQGHLFGVWVRMLLWYMTCFWPRPHLHKIEWPILMNEGNIMWTFICSKWLELDDVVYICSFYSLFCTPLRPIFSFALLENRFAHTSRTIRL